jgi:hypothetical protein
LGGKGMGGVRKKQQRLLSQRHGYENQHLGITAENDTSKAQLGRGSYCSRREQSSRMLPSLWPSIDCQSVKPTKRGAVLPTRWLGEIGAPPALAEEAMENLFREGPLSHHMDASQAKISHLVWWTVDWRARLRANRLGCVRCE